MGGVLADVDAVTVREILDLLAQGRGVQIFPREVELSRE